MLFVDTHAHIYLEQFSGDQDAVIARAVDSSVGKIYMPNVDSSTIPAMLSVEGRNPETCFAMIGLHPCSIDQNMDREIGIMEEWLTKRQFVGIGETGTDLYWEKRFYDRQVESLEIHIGWAKEYRVPIILHSRDSLDQTIDIIERNHDERLRGIFHCFTGSADQARRIIDLDFMLGIGGVLTFRNSKLDETMKGLSLSHVVLETDSPYLSPVPYRGKRNEPAYLLRTASALAEIFGTTINEIARITTQNAEKTFKDR